MTLRYRVVGRAVLAFCFAGLLSSSHAVAQQPGGQFTNLQVLPKDIAAPDLMKLMAQYNQELGVQCSFCHDGNFAADSKPEKKIARIMISMTTDINTKYLATLPEGGAKASCYTCHRGHPEPEAPPASTAGQ
jgi:Photosynthetic reaction centre cytochrome C subunit